MIALPFIYFGLLLVNQLRKNKWQVDIASYILAIYAVSGFFSILIDVFNLRSLDTIHYSISLYSSLCYCGLLTLCVWPFMRYSNLQIKKIKPIKNPGFIKIVVTALAVFFIINLVFSFQNIIEVVTSDDLNRIRKDHKDYEDESWISSLPFPFRQFFVFLNLISGASWISIFLAFFLIVVQKGTRKYGYLSLIASFNGIIGSVLDGGRSAIMMWFIGFLACYLFFKPFMNGKQKRTVRIVFFVLGSLFVTFVTAVTISRFGDRDAGSVSGSQGGLISYAGQSYINFCYFWDTFDCPMPTLQVLFPFTSKLLGSPVENAIALQGVLSAMSNRELGVFYTFIGHIATSSHNIVAVIYCILISVLSINIINRINNHQCSITICYSYLMFSSILFMGLFGHYYAYSGKTMSILFFAIVLSRFKK